MHNFYKLHAKTALQKGIKAALRAMEYAENTAMAPAEITIAVRHLMIALNSYNKAVIKEWHEDRESLILENK